MRYVLAVEYCQDHIETLCSKIRAMHGFNNNPDILQFKAALKSLFHKQNLLMYRYGTACATDWN